MGLPSNPSLYPGETILAIGHFTSQGSVPCMTRLTSHCDVRHRSFGNAADTVGFERGDLRMGSLQQALPARLGEIPVAALTGLRDMAQDRIPGFLAPERMAMAFNDFTGLPAMAGNVLFR